MYFSQYDSQLYLQMIYLNYEIKELHNTIENYNHNMYVYGIKHMYIYLYISFEGLVIIVIFFTE